MITINDLPTITELTESDKLIVFSQNSNGTVSPEIKDISSVVSLAVDRSMLNDLLSRFNDVEKAEAKLEKELSSMYATKDYISAYSTNDYFDSTTQDIKKTGDFEVEIKVNATKEYLETKYQSVLYQMQNLKRLLGTGGWTTDEQAIGYKITLAAKAKNPGE